MKNKWFLYLTGFFSGMSVMAIELGAQRMLAPYFSSSQIVWTIVIGVIMIAMALGNVLGGRMADRHKDPKHLFIWLLAAAVWAALIPVVGRYVIAGVALGLALVVTKNYLIWAALTTCILIYVFPLLVLGMVTPNLVRFALGEDGSGSGKTVGIIEALNTIGSIIGTFLPTFVTIPSVGTAMTFMIFASILLVICAIYFFLIRSLEKNAGEKKPKNVVKAVILVLVVALAFGAGFASVNTPVAFWQDNILCEDESVYNYLRVEDAPDSVIFSTNVLFGVQSMKMKQGGLTRGYYDHLLAGPIMAGATHEKLNVLVLGLGTGTFISLCRDFFEDQTYTGVEIDQKIIDIAYKYFDLPADVNAVCDDGRSYLTLRDEKYDVILVDAYQDITIPFQMSSVEFFQLVADRLTENGVMIVNMNMYTSNEGGINDYLCGTIKQVFSSAATSRSGSNRILYASNSFDVVQQLEKEAASVTDDSLKNLAYGILYNLEDVESSEYVLTDDKAPVELLGISAIDNMIMSEIGYYRNLIAGKSIPQLIKELQEGKLF